MKTQNKTNLPGLYQSPETLEISLGATENFLTSGGEPEGASQTDPYSGISDPYGY